MKVASFNIRADARQSARWKQAAEAEGFASVGAWATGAIDAFLEHRTRAGRPVPLAWHRGTFRAVVGGLEVPLHGMISPPFAYFRGTDEGPVAGHRFSLMHTPTGKLIATLRTARQARSLASELAPLLLRDQQAAAAVTARHIREAT